MTLIDVRSPGEFAKGHIPGAISFPLFTDAERAEVGTLYKKVGQEMAFERGLTRVGPKLAGFVRKAREFEGALEVYCWRGGMRSQSMVWLLTTAGFEASQRKGGYKAYRRHVHALFEKPLKLRVLGGLTGCGKSDHLQKLKIAGEQVIDLEGLANHKGSVFGDIGMGAQPTTEHFENLIGQTLKGFDLDREIWIEDESRLVGRCKIPDPLFEKMKVAPRTFLESSFEERVERLVRDYGGGDREKLKEATLRLTKRLGGLRTQHVLAAIDRGEMGEAATLLLNYYDSAYEQALKKLKVGV